MNKSIIFLLILFVGCTTKVKVDHPEVEQASQGKPFLSTPIDDYDAKIESWTDERGNTHEYIYFKSNYAFGGGSMTHYPDCKYCLEKNKD